jgi:hypothetical protein
MSQIDRRINNIEAQIAGLSAGSGVQSVVAGTNVTITGSPSNPVINSTAGASGVSSLSAGSGISVSSSTGAITVVNTGVNTLTAGTNITLTGSATNPIVSVTSVGVQTVTAGSNVTITGTSTNPIINATPTSVVSNGAVSNLNFLFDTIGTPLTIPANQIGNAFCYCNTVGANAQTLYLPNVTALTTQFGANAVVNFFIGQLNVTIFNPLFPNSSLATFVISPTGNEYWENNYTTQAPTSPLTVSGWTSYTTSNSLHFPALYKVQITIQGGKAFYYFDYAGFGFP